MGLKYVYETSTIMSNPREIIHWSNVSKTMWVTAKPLGQVAAGGHPLEPQQSDQCWGSDITPLETLMGEAAQWAAGRPLLTRLFFASLRSESEHCYCFWLLSAALTRKMINSWRTRTRRCWGTSAALNIGRTRIHKHKRPKSIKGWVIWLKMINKLFIINIIIFVLLNVNHLKVKRSIFLSQIFALTSEICRNQTVNYGFIIIIFTLYF